MRQGVCGLHRCQGPGDDFKPINQRLISVSSPFARALIGKSEGDSFEFQAPNGTRNYEIIGVRYEV